MKRPAKSQDDSEDVAPTPKKPRTAATNASSSKQANEENPEVSEDESECELDWYPKRVESPWKFGPHVSAAGGVENAVLNAANIGATAFALFLKQQRQWTSKDLSESSVRKFKRRMEKLGYDAKCVLPHGSYLVNLGNPDAEKREKSYKCFLDDLKRCEQLGLLLYNFHPGSTVGQTTKETSLSHVAQCINRAHKETESVVVVIENMAGANNVLGSHFSEIGAIIREVEDKSRVGVCLDTCHMFAAGYDIRTKDGWDAMMSEFTEEIGLQYLRGMHINDSKGELGGGKDRHENLGLGHLTLRTFSHILSDERTQGIPLILETPAHDGKGKSRNKSKGMEWDVWKKEVEILGRLVTLPQTSPSTLPVSESWDASDEKDEQENEQLLAKWTEEIRGVVGRCSGGGEASSSKKTTNSSTKVKGGKGKGKKVDEEEEGEEDMDMGE
ncbi:xylose isomerase-like protein [Irpex lacteus]|nr:xylose isomerase-like protein [Irpex lacteus]